MTGNAGSDWTMYVIHILDVAILQNSILSMPDLIGTCDPHTSDRKILLSCLQSARMDGPIHPFPCLYAPDRRQIKSMVKYCGVRFRVAAQELLKMDHATSKNLQPILGEELASIRFYPHRNILS